MSRISIYKGNDLAGGLNDTPFPNNREQSQAHTQTNYRVLPDLSLERLLGRKQQQSGFDGTVKQLLIPPRREPLLTINNSNTRLITVEIQDDNNAYLTYYTSVADGTYYSYDELATALQTALNTPNSTTPTLSVEVASATAGVPGVGDFTVAGDYESEFIDGATFVVSDSASNDGTYTVDSSSHSGGTTTIYVDESVPANSASDGEILLTSSANDNLLGTFTVTYNTSLTLNISAVTKVGAGSDSITVDGGYKSMFAALDQITVSGSTGNDGTYTVASPARGVLYASGVTEIDVDEALASAVADGDVVFSNIKRFVVGYSETNFLNMKIMWGTTPYWYGDIFGRGSGRRKEDVARAGRSLEYNFGRGSIYDTHFGFTDFTFLAEIGSTGAGEIVSDHDCFPEDKLNDIVAMSASKSEVMNSSGSPTEIGYPKGDSVTVGADVPTGVWNYGRWYGVSDNQNLILRDKFFRKMPDQSKVWVQATTENTARPIYTHDQVTDDDQQFPIVGGDSSAGGPGGDYFSIEGDYTNLFTAGDTFEVVGNTSATSMDGTYTVDSSSYDAGNDETDITMTVGISGLTFDGVIYYNPMRAGFQMAYEAIKIEPHTTGGVDMDDYSIYCANYFKIRCRRDSSKSDDWVLHVFLDSPNFDERLYLTTILPGDVSQATNVAEVIKTIYPGVPTASSGDDGASVILSLVTPETDLSNISLYIGFREGTTLTKTGQYWDSSLYTWTSLGQYADTDPVIDYNPQFTLEVDGFTYSGTCKYKAALQNSEGFETELTDELAELSSVSDKAIGLKFTFDVDSSNSEVYNYDFRWLNIYRTIDDDDEYYLVAKIPDRMFKKAIALNGYVIVYDGVSEGDIASSTQADTTTKRTANIRYKYSAWFDNSNWVAGQDDSEDVVLYSQTDSSIPAPESFNQAKRFFQIGTDGSPVKGLSACGDRLVVFKQRSIHLIIPYGTNGYKIQESSSNGVGTTSPQTLVSVNTSEGPSVFFQGNDGHFYVTDGLRVVNISGNDESNSRPARLQTLVGSLNKEFLHVNWGVYSPDRDEIIWSVCTGSNETPDTVIVFQVGNGTFYKSDLTADIWGVSTIETDSSYVGRSLVVGAKSQEIFYWDESESGDDSPGVGTDETYTCEYETADWDCGMFDVYKDIHNVELGGEHAGTTGTQTATLKKYLNRSTTATAPNGTITFTPDYAEHIVYITKEAKQIRFELTETAQNKRTKFNQFIVEYAPVRSTER